MSKLKKIEAKMASLPAKTGGLAYRLAAVARLDPTSTMLLVVMLVQICILIVAIWRGWFGFHVIERPTK